MTPTPGPGERVEEIRARHVAFIEQYSPGPDWEPCNQMSLDRGWLLAHIAALDTALAASRGKHHESRMAEDVLAEKLRDAERLGAEWQQAFYHAEQRAGQNEQAMLMQQRLRFEAEQRVAAWEAAAEKIRKCNVVSVYESDNRLMRDFIGIARPHFDELMALLTPPPVAPSAKGVAHRAACDENHEHEVRKGCCAPDCPACHPVAPAGGVVKEQCAIIAESFDPWDEHYPCCKQAAAKAIREAK